MPDRRSSLVLVAALAVVLLGACGQGDCDMAPESLVVIGAVQEIDGSDVTFEVESVPVNDTEITDVPVPGDVITVDVDASADKLRVGARYRVPLIDDRGRLHTSIREPDADCPWGMTRVDGSAIDQPPWIVEHWEISALILCALLVGSALALAVASRRGERRRRAVEP